MKNTYSDTKTYVTDKEVDKKLMSNINRLKDHNLFHFFGRETQPHGQSGQNMKSRDKWERNPQI